MSKQKEVYNLPHLPKEVYTLVDEYNSKGPKILTYLQSDSIPDLPQDVLSLIANYYPPVTKDDLIVMYALDPSGKALAQILGVKDQNNLKRYAEIIAMPDETKEEIWSKFNAGYRVGYYPLLLYLYRKLRQIEERGVKIVGIERSVRFLKSAIKIRDFPVVFEVVNTNPQIVRETLRNFLDSDDHDVAEFLLRNFLTEKYGYSKEDNRATKRLLNRLHFLGWFDLMVFVLDYANDYQLYAWLFPDLEKEPILFSFIKRKLDDLKGLEKTPEYEMMISEIIHGLFRHSSYVEGALEMLRQLGVEEGLIRKWAQHFGNRYF